MSGSETMCLIRQHSLNTLVVLLIAAVGCNSVETTSPVKKIVIPAGIAGTVAHYADLVGGNAMLVKGYGVVVGLGDKGSSDVPESVRKYMIQEMSKKGVGLPSAGGGGLSPTRMLADKDTAMVEVFGLLPPAAPVGARFDLYLQCPARTQTTSLDGGYLLPVDMRFAMVSSMAQFSNSKPWGVGRGQLFVNPFVARAKPDQQTKLRIATVPNGGVVTREKPIRLEMRSPNYARLTLIQRRLRQRFEDEKVAIGKSASLIELHIPRMWRRDYMHFLRLLMHVYVNGDAADEDRYARRMAREILLPTARGDDISLAWEAMGKQVLPVIRPLYNSKNPAAAFYSVRAGLRLQDTTALDPMLALAGQMGSPVQMLAVAELGRATRYLRSVPTLKRLLNSKDEQLRVAVYEALVNLGSTTSVRRVGVGGHFALDIVDSKRDYVIYATHTGPPKIVLFGANIPILKPVFYTPGDELVTITDRPRDGDQQVRPIRLDQPEAGGGVRDQDLESTKTLLVYRKLPKGSRRSAPFYIAPLVEQLVTTLAGKPEMDTGGKIEGMALTYSQVIGILEGMCKAGHIPAKFVLQPSPQMQRIYDSATGVGRPDMPEEGQ